MCPTVINGRWLLDLPEHRAARPQWDITNGGWEPERLADMADHLGDGDVIYDIGAEEGDLPALWASWGCRVVLFEPNPRVWPNIRVIFDGNDLSDRVLASFVGFAGERDYEPDSRNRLVRWELAERWPREAYGPVIGDHGFLNLCERPDVPSITVDTAASETMSPTAITIDVEGAELRVLKGAVRTLATYRPIVWVSIHPEFMGEMYGDRPDQIHDLMGGLGYEGQHLATDHEEHWRFS
jgi:FkbM family methyltransferase